MDKSIQQIGYLPGTNGNGNGHHAEPAETDKWNGSFKQRGLILKTTEEHKLDKNQAEQLALDRFGTGVKALNKLEASGLIDELLK